ncbi:MAG TPA: CYTH domain-containing protein [Candidatus Saccharimonadales bacterium]|jgi:adenylate cyclase class 2|nr:CYTH domain-containing protein [Candidatus Saccharimonadales bacterium]
MQTEIEAKFARIDHDDMRRRLKAAGGVCEQPMRLLRRVILDYPDGRLQKDNSYIRVRDEGHRVTVTLKKFVGDGINGAKEIEFTASDFMTPRQLFEAVGMKVQSEQESKRETWTLDTCEVVLDEWPWVKPMMEIEGPSERAVKETAAKLDLNWADALFGDVTKAYLVEYDIAAEKISTNDLIRFDMPVPDWLQRTRR